VIAVTSCPIIFWTPRDSLNRVAGRALGSRGEAAARSHHVRGLRRTACAPGPDASPQLRQISFSAAAVKLPRSITSTNAPRGIRIEATRAIKIAYCFDQAAAPCSSRQTAARRAYEPHPVPIPAELPKSRRTAVRVIPGAICLSSSTHFPLKLYSNCVKPVALPPGRGRCRALSQTGGHFRASNQMS
jgi:hypothetical protein